MKPSWRNIQAGSGSQVILRILSPVQANNSILAVELGTGLI